jgi:FdhD protein
MADRAVHRRIFHWDRQSLKPSDDRVIGEEPLSIRIQGRPYSVIMRTPGEELFHVAGFCLGEGIADQPDDIQSLAFCDGSDTNVVTVTLTESRRNLIPEILERRQFVSQTSCGLCGKEIVNDLYLQIQPVTKNTRIDLNRAYECLNNLSTLQPLREKTRSSHAAALYSEDLSVLSSAEDVGRHNALDKAVGKLFLGHRLHEAAILVLSSRISYELVQKASRAKIPIIMAVSRPTDLAVELAFKMNILLICLSKGNGLDVFCNEDRIKSV